MIQFTENNYGLPISESLSDILKRWTSKKDEADISIITGVGLSTIRDVKNRSNSLTENNSKAILELYARAKQNANKKKLQAELDFDFA